jgi:hypothetical protein
MAINNDQFENYMTEHQFVSIITFLLGYLLLNSGYETTWTDRWNLLAFYHRIL